MCIRDRMAQDMPIGALLAEEGFNTVASSRTAREALVRYGLTTVSYTHLDVYKRQLYGGTCIESCAAFTWRSKHEVILLLA